MTPEGARGMATPGGALMALHVSVALFGFAGLFGKWIPWDPVAIVFGRTAVAAMVLAALALRRSGRVVPPGGALVVNGVILAVHWVAFFAAVQVSTVAVALLGFASFPLFTPLVERWLLGVRPAAHAWRDAALVACGLLLVVPEFTWASATVRGLVLGIASGFTFALLAVRTRRLRDTRGATDIALWQNAIAALCVAPWVVAQGVGGPVTWQALAWVAVLGVACTALAHSLFASSLAHVPAATAAIIAALEPVYGIALAALLQDEWPTGRTLAGAAVLVTVAAMASRRARVSEPL